MGQYVVAYTVGAVLLILLLLMLARPIKLVFKLVINSALGCLGLIIFNLIGGLAGLYIGINLVTAATVGILGLPGLALILFLQFLL